MELLALAALAVAVVAMLLITQTKQRVTWPGWLVPVAAFVPLAAWTTYAILNEGLSAFWPIYTNSLWGVQLWCDRVVTVTVAFYLLQNRARAAGMKSEVWVLLVIFTGSLGLLPMLAQMLYLERKPAPSA
jgi:hypothetical protein